MLDAREERLCPQCGGDGGAYYLRGWRQTGSGFGDCEEIETYEKCGMCDGYGRVGAQDDEESAE